MTVDAILLDWLRHLQLLIQQLFTIIYDYLPMALPIQFLILFTSRDGSVKNDY